MKIDPWLLAWVDYYEELTVSANASIRVIQAAYRVMAQDFHPDGGRTADAERMTRINVAFEILSDPPTRQRYDQIYRMHQPQPADFVPPPPPIWPATDPSTSPRSTISDPPHKAWDELLSFGVLMAGMLGLLVAVIIVLATQ